MTGIVNVNNNIIDGIEYKELFVMKGVYQFPNYVKKFYSQCKAEFFNDEDIGKLFSIMRSFYNRNEILPSLDEIIINVDEPGDLIKCHKLIMDVEITDEDNWQRETNKFLSDKYIRCIGISNVNLIDSGREDEAYLQMQNIEPPSLNSSITKGVKSLSEIVNTDYPAIRWLIPGILPEGLTLFAGKPKIGKSFMALNLSIQIAAGYKCLDVAEAEPGDVLYISLEDPHRRIKTRVNKMLPGGAIPDNVYVIEKWNTMNEGGIEAIHNWMEEHPATRLIIIDTFVKVMNSKPNTSKGIYKVDTKEMEPFKKIVDDYGIAIILVHHTRKEGSDDPLDMVSGSQGLAGGSDNVMVLTKSRGDKEAKLFITGRDVEKENTWATNFDGAWWKIVGDADKLLLSKQRLEIKNVFKTENRDLTIPDIIEITDGVYKTISYHLTGMVEDGILEKVARGKYKLVVIRDIIYNDDNVVL